MMADYYEEFPVFELTRVVAVGYGFLVNLLEAEV